MVLALGEQAVRTVRRQHSTCLRGMSSRGHGSRRHLNPLQRLVRHFKSSYTDTTENALQTPRKDEIETLSSDFYRIRIGGTPSATPSKHASAGPQGVHASPSWSQEYSSHSTPQYGLHESPANAHPYGLQNGHGRPLLLPYGGGDLLPAMPAPTPVSYANTGHKSTARYPSMPLPSAQVRPHSVAFEKKPSLPNSWELSSGTPKGHRHEPVCLSTSASASTIIGKQNAPATNRQSRSEALVEDPSELPGLRQCWGIKRDGKRCMRRIGHATGTASAPSTPQKGGSRSPAKVKTGSAHPASIIRDESSSDDAYSSDDDEQREYCHQHAREINKTEGFVLPGRRASRRRRSTSLSRVPSSSTEGRYVDFEPYMSTVDGLKGDVMCKARLRAAMCRAPSEVDWKDRGYIYVYELRDRSTPTHIALKIGRAGNVYKRFEQWRSQCQSKSPLLRAFFPRPAGGMQSVLPGASSVIEQGTILSHKWESLCHIELSALGTRLNDKCNDCGSRHREIFLVPRERGGYESVCILIEKWLGFVQSLARDGGVDS